MLLSTEQCGWYAVVLLKISLNGPPQTEKRSPNSTACRSKFPEKSRHLSSSRPHARGDIPISFLFKKRQKTNGPSFGCNTISFALRVVQDCPAFNIAVCPSNEIPKECPCVRPRSYLWDSSHFLLQPESSEAHTLGVCSAKECVLALCLHHFGRGPTNYKHPTTKKTCKALLWFSENSTGSSTHGQSPLHLLAAVQNGRSPSGYRTHLPTS